MVDFGRDMSCTDSLKTGRFATGTRLVGEACYRRLTTPRGMLRGGEAEADYGYDLSVLIGSTSVKSAAASLPGRIEAELLKDERVESVSVDVTVFTEGPDTAFTIEIEAVTSVGPFTLTLLASAVTVELLGITAEAA